MSDTDLKVNLFFFSKILFKISFFVLFRHLILMLVILIGINIGIIIVLVLNNIFFVKILLIYQGVINEISGKIFNKNIFVLLTLYL